MNEAQNNVLSAPSAGDDEKWREALSDEYHQLRNSPVGKQRRASMRAKPILLTSGDPLSHGRI